MARILHFERAVGVDPRLLDFLNECARKFAWDIVVVCGNRTAAEQEALFLQGRETPGPNAGLPGHGVLGDTVTKARTAEDSSHGHGGGIDLAPAVNGKVPWLERDPDHPEFLRRLGLMGALAAERGLVWGGTWRSRDLDHFQVPNWRDLPLL